MDKIVVNADVLKLLNAHDLIMEQGFRGIITMEEAQASQLRLQAKIMKLRKQQQRRNK